MKTLSLFTGFTLGLVISGSFFMAQYAETHNFVSSLVQSSTVETLHASQSLKTEQNFENIFINLPEDKKQLVEEILGQIPSAQYQSLKKIVADNDPKARRGLASYKSLYLGINAISSDKEFKRVFIHELGHILDLGGLKASEQKIDSGFRDGSNIIYESDPSLDFYRFCFQDESTQNRNCGDLDYVSQYAQIDPFEDFAETYLLFIENNDSFLKMTKESKILAQKYDFFAQKVFHGNIPQSSEIKLPQGKRVWDLTKI